MRNDASPGRRPRALPFGGARIATLTSAVSPSRGGPDKSAPWAAAARSLTAGIALSAVALAGVLAAPSPEAGAATSATIRPVAYWEQQFLQAAESNHSTNLPLSKSGDSRKFYDLAYALDANVSMYEATGKAAYMDRALLYAGNMVDDARPSSSLGSKAFGDSYLGWTSKATDSGNAHTSGTEVPLFESYAWRYVARMLRVVREAPGLYQNGVYRAQYDRLLAFTEKNMFDKWLGRGANSYVYRSNTHMASHWAYIALEVERLTTDQGRKQRARTVVDNIDLHLPNYKGASLKGQMRLGTVAPGAYFWSASWGSSSSPGQDVAHGNAVASYVTEAHDLGRTWTSVDMTRFASTLTDVIMPSADYVDGSGSGTGWFADGLVKLGRYSMSTQQRLEAHRVQGQLQYMASMAVNARRLTNGATLPAPAPTPTSTPTPSPNPTPTATPTPRPRPTPRTALTTSVTHANARVGTQSVITGTVSPAAVRASVSLQQRRSNAWKTVGATTLNARSQVRFTPGIGSRGTFRYRVHVAARNGSPALTSPTIKLTRF